MWLLSRVFIPPYPYIIYIIYILYFARCSNKLRTNYRLVQKTFDSLRGGGGGVHPDYFVKLDFEIAVDQQTRARDRTFEGVPDSGCPRDSHAHIWSICGPILPNDLNMLKTMDKNWLSYEQNAICHIWAYATKYDIFWALAHKLGKYQYFSMKPTLYER